MQTILNTLYSCAGCVDASVDQSPFGMWATVPGTDPTQQLSFEFAGNSNTNGFGIWSDANGDTDVIGRTLIPIFGGPSQAGDLAVVSFGPGSTITISASINAGGAINVGTFAGISSSSFGYFLSTSGYSPFFTADQLNGGAAQAVAYNKVGTKDWVIGFEDLPFSEADRDYNDLIVKVGSIQGANPHVPQVPEPSTFLMFGTLLVCSSSLLRRHLRRNSREVITSQNDSQPS